MSALARIFLKNNSLTISIVLFLTIFYIVNMVKPALMYDEYGEIRPFGVGYSHKTIMPIWLFAIVLAIMCYLIIQILAKNIYRL